MNQLVNQSQKITKIINSKQEMSELAQNLAQNLNTMFKIPTIICLDATLGAGKTFFAGEFINYFLEKKQSIQSPTFNLLYCYDSKQAPIYHFDLYRLKSEEELENIGFFDAIKNGICLIEWPQLAKKYLTNYININIKTSSSSNEEQREVTITNINQ